MRDKLFRGIAIFLCAVMVAIPVFNNNMLTAQAAETTSNVSVNKIFDMALSKAGVVASPSTLNSVKDYLYTLMLDYGDGYLQYLKDNNLDNTPENCQAYFDTLDYSSYPAGVEDICRSYTMAKFMSDFYSFFDEQIDENTVNDTNLLSFLGLKDAVKGVTYSIGSDFVNLLKLIFEKKTVNDLGYYYMPSYKIQDIPSVNFSTPEDITHLVNFCSNLGDNVLLLSTTTYEPYTPSMVYGYAGCGYFVDAVNLGLISDIGTADCSVRGYSYSWTALNAHFAGFKKYTDYETFISSTSTNVLKYYKISTLDTNFGGNCLFITTDARQIIVFNSVDAMKLYTTEQAPYYTTRDYGTYSTTNDNSVTYTGDYMIEYGDTTTYGDITTNNDYSQDTIDNSVTYITNNYNYATPEGDEGGSGSGSSDSGIGLGDALTSLVQGVGDFFAFILSLLGELVSLVSNFLTSALEMLKGLTGLFSGFTGLLGAIFPFIPQELIDVLTTGITLIVLIGVIRSFK